MEGSRLQIEAAYRDFLKLYEILEVRKIFGLDRIPETAPPLPWEEKLEDRRVISPVDTHMFASPEEAARLLEAKRKDAREAFKPVNFPT